MSWTDEALTGEREHAEDMRAWGRRLLPPRACGRDGHDWTAYDPPAFAAAVRAAGFGLAGTPPAPYVACASCGAETGSGAPEGAGVA